MAVLYCYAICSCKCVDRIQLRSTLVILPLSLIARLMCIAFHLFKTTYIIAESYEMIRPIEKFTTLFNLFQSRFKQLHSLPSFMKTAPINSSKLRRVCLQALNSNLPCKLANKGRLKGRKRRKSQVARDKREAKRIEQFLRTKRWESNENKRNKLKQMGTNCHNNR